MVEADAELPLPVRTSPILAQLVLRRLNLREGGIAQKKTRTPQRRTQESFASGTASVHAGLLIPLRIAPLAILTQQITLWYAVFAASTTEKQVYGLSRREMDPKRTSSTSRAVQVSGWVRTLVTAHEYPPFAASSLRLGERVCCSLLCRSGEGLLQGHFRGTQSCHLLVSRQEETHCVVDCAIADPLPTSCAVRFNLPSAESSATHVPDVTTATAIAQVTGWIRTPVASANAIPPTSASSPGLVQAPVCLSCLSGHGESSLQGYFRSARSFNLIVSRQEGTHYLLDIAMTDALPCSCAVRLSLYSKGSCSRQVNDASHLAKLLTRIRAIRWIRPLAAPTHAIPPRTASSRRLGVQKWDVPCCVATERACGKDTSQACRRGMFSCLGRTTHMRPWQVVDLIANAGPCSCAARFKFPPAGSMKRLLTTSRAIVQVPGSIRSPLLPAAASSCRLGAGAWSGFVALTLHRLRPPSFGNCRLHNPGPCPVLQQSSPAPAHGSSPASLRFSASASTCLRLCTSPTQVFKLPETSFA